MFAISTRRENKGVAASTAKERTVRASSRAAVACRRRRAAAAASSPHVPFCTSCWRARTAPVAFPPRRPTQSPLVYFLRAALGCTRASSAQRQAEAPGLEQPHDCSAAPSASRVLLVPQKLLRAAWKDCPRMSRRAKRDKKKKETENAECKTNNPALSTNSSVQMQSQRSRGQTVSSK